MNALTEHLLQEFKPRVALICYEGKRQYYIDAHPINEEGQMMEGKPIQQDTLLGMLDVIYDENADKIKMGGFLPECLLYYQLLPGGDYKLIWYRPEEQRNLAFTSNIHLKSGNAWVPAMVYVASKHSLRVFALSSDCRPTPDTELCYGPFYNVSPAGTVCLGSAKAEKPADNTYLSFIRYWEQIFWASEFSALHNTKATKTNINLIWKNLLKNNDLKWSAIDELVPCTPKKTIADLIK